MEAVEFILDFRIGDYGLGNALRDDEVRSEGEQATGDTDSQHDSVPGTKISVLFRMKRETGRQ